MKLYLALPALNESACLQAFIDSLKAQEDKGFELFACVNQPDHWWEDPIKRDICLDNRQSIQYLQKDHGFPIHCIDRSSKGKGWKGKHFGVGWARKTVMDAINQIADKDDLIVSMDADTDYPPGYLTSLKNLFAGQKNNTGLANPYYHKLTGDEAVDRAILHYEIYMRNYAINMLLIENPYAFTALGSAMAAPVWAYHKIGGITPHKSGEDFYFLQKLRKSGELITHNDIRVYPSARRSNRVLFGTGPAIIKGTTGNWESYPIYHHGLFRKVGETFAAFPDLFQEDIELPMTSFLIKTFKSNNFWEGLRENASNCDVFVRACMTKVDALRILQFLKTEQRSIALSDEECMLENLNEIARKTGTHIPLQQGFSFSASEIPLLDILRNHLFKLESELQREIA